MILVSPFEYSNCSGCVNDESNNIVSYPQLTYISLESLNANIVENISSSAYTLIRHPSPTATTVDISITKPIFPLACSIPLTFVDKNELQVGEERSEVSDVKSEVKM